MDNNDNKNNELVKAITDDKVKQVIFSNEKKSRKLLEDRDKLETFLNKLEIKLSGIPLVGEKLADVPVLISMVRSYAKGEYRAVPVKTIIAIISGLIYLLSPVDLIPDFIPGIGYIDDAAVIAFVVKSVFSDIEDYRQWRDNNIQLA